MLRSATVYTKGDALLRPIPEGKGLFFLADADAGVYRLSVHPFLSAALAATPDLSPVILGMLRGVSYWLRPISRRLCQLCQPIR